MLKNMFLNKQQRIRLNIFVVIKYPIKIQISATATSHLLKNFHDIFAVHKEKYSGIVAITMSSDNLKSLYPPIFAESTNFYNANSNTQ